MVLAHRLKPEGLDTSERRPTSEFHTKNPGANASPPISAHPVGSIRKQNIAAGRCRRLPAGPRPHLRIHQACTATPAWSSRSALVGRGDAGGPDALAGAASGTRRPRFRLTADAGHLSGMPYVVGSSLPAKPRAVNGNAP